MHPSLPSWGDLEGSYYADAARIASKIGSGYDNPIAYTFDSSQVAIAFDIMKEELTLLTGDTIENISCDFVQITHLQGDSSKYENALYFYHGNHLSSTQLVTDINGDVTQAVLYGPWGSTISEYKADWMLDTIPRYLFNSKEKDEESGLYYYEARYYDPNGTFISRDPMFEKYFWMSPYAYCANNPLRYVDPTGKDVETTEEGLAVLQNTVSKEDAKFIRLTDDGKIDKDYLNQCENNEGNMGKLKEIVNNERIVNFSISDKFDYQTENGVKPNDMGEIDIDFSYMGMYSLSTGEKGHLGQTQYPNGEIGTWTASTNGKTNVITNKNLSLQGRAETAAHELYGHVYLNIKGFDSSHRTPPQGGSTDLNSLLKVNIIGSMQEVQRYFKN